MAWDKKRVMVKSGTFDGLLFSAFGGKTCSKLIDIVVGTWKSVH